MLLSIEAQLNNICSESMSTARMRLYSINEVKVEVCVTMTLTFPFSRLQQPL